MTDNLGLTVDKIAERVADWFRLRDAEGLQAALRNLVEAVEARRVARAARRRS